MVDIPRLQNYIPDSVFLALLIGISLLDIFANSLNAVPVLGVLAETVSESALEGIQILIVLLFGERQLK